MGFEQASQNASCPWQTVRTTVTLRRSRKILVLVFFIALLYRAVGPTIAAISPVQVWVNTDAFIASAGLPGKADESPLRGLSKFFKTSVFIDK